MCVLKQAFCLVTITNLGVMNHDSKVLDHANQLHTFQNSEDSTTGIVEVLLFENHSSVLLTTLRRRVSIISFMKYM